MWNICIQSRVNPYVDGHDDRLIMILSGSEVERQDPAAPKQFDWTSSGTETWVGEDFTIVSQLPNIAGEGSAIKLDMMGGHPNNQTVDVKHHKLKLVGYYHPSGGSL